jgi:hypothetical protein
LALGLLATTERSDEIEIAALRELLAVAIEDTAEQLAQAALALLRGDDGQAAAVRAHHSRMGALLDLLESVAGP